MIDKGMVVADIGTDHAFLPVMLVRDGISDHVYACDVAKGPLQAAKENIAHFQLTDKITTILTDGLRDVPSDVNCIVIAGMGFVTAKGRYSIGLGYTDYKVAQHTHNYHRWVSDTNNNWENVGADGGTYARIRR